MTDDLDGPDYDCPGCQGGDKWPAAESVWRCPVCDTEFHDTDVVPSAEAMREETPDGGKGE